MKLILALFFIAMSVGSFAETWTQKANFGGSARHRSTAFAIGNKGYLGLGHINSVTNILYDDFWEYDAASNAWTQKANYPYPCYHATGFSIGPKAYVGTGRKQDNSYTTDFFVYDPVLNTWSSISNFPGTSRRGAISFVVNEMGDVGTGQTIGGGSNNFYSYNPNTNLWNQIASFPGSSRTSSVAFLIQDIGYVGTGNSGGGTNDFWAYYPGTNQWVQKANVGPTPRQEATGLAVNGFGYIGTGDDFSSGTNYGDMWEYNPDIDSWIQINDFSGTPRRYLSSMVIDGVAYVGTGTSGANFKDFWRFDHGLGLIESNSNFKVHLFPNPTIDKVTFSFNSEESNKEKSILIYSSDGQLVLSEKVTNEKFTWHTEHTGIFIYSFVMDNSIQETGKLIVR